MLGNVVAATEVGATATAVKPAVSGTGADGDALDDQVIRADSSGPNICVIKTTEETKDTDAVLVRGLVTPSPARGRRPTPPLELMPRDPLEAAWLNAIALVFPSRLVSIIYNIIYTSLIFFTVTKQQRIIEMAARPIFAFAQRAPTWCTRAPNCSIRAPYCTDSLSPSAHYFSSSFFPNICSLSPFHLPSFLSFFFKVEFEQHVERTCIVAFGGLKISLRTAESTAAAAAKLAQYAFDPDEMPEFAYMRAEPIVTVVRRVRCVVIFISLPPPLLPPPVSLATARFSTCPSHYIYK